MICSVDHVHNCGSWQCEVGLIRYPFVHKIFSDLNKIWYVGRGQRVINVGMPYDPIYGQGHGGLKCVKMADFKVYLLRQFACNQKTNSDA